jgi:predicted phage terminase large subunit-like protein
VAREYLSEIRATSPPSTDRPKLIDWVAEKAPELERFEYFRPYAEAFEQAIGGSLRVAFAAPPQHGKTLLSLWGLLWLARFFPGYRHAYVTYNETRADDVAKDFRRLADQAGIGWSGTLDTVELDGGTTVKFTSVKGTLTGYAIDGLCLIDDPIKGQRESRSATVRRDVVAWWKTEARTRRHPGTSYITMATRWHIADLPGHLIKDESWSYLNFKAIAEPDNSTGKNDIDADGRILSDPIHRKPGESLSPLKPPEFFERERKDLFWWASMYQGQPMPDGGARFQTPTRYTQLPLNGYREGWGVDLAYTAKTSANYSVCIAGRMTLGPDLNAEKKPRARLYLTDCQRKQVDAPAFTLTLKSMTAGKRGPMRWYCATSEKGAGQFVKDKISTFEIKLATADKLVRATPVAAAWNRGDVLVPVEAPWLEDLLDEVLSFTGINDPHDDQVDALAALWDALNLPEWNAGTFNVRGL